MPRSQWKWLLPALIPFAIGFPMANLNSWRPRRVRVAGKPFQVAFSPDGGRVALASQSNSSAPGRVEFWKVEAASRFAQPGVSEGAAFAVGEPLSICFSGDSETLFCTAEGQIHRFDVKSRKKLPVLRNKNVERTDSHAQMWPHRDVLAFRSYNGIVQSDTRTGKSRSSFPVTATDDSENASLVALTPDGQSSALSFDYNEHLVLRDTRSGSKRLLPKVLPASTGNLSCTVTALTFSPDSQFLSVAWDAQVSKANGSLVSSSRVSLWDCVANKVAAKWIETDKSIKAHAFSPDGAVLAAARDDGAISLRDAHTGHLIRLLKTAGTSVQSVAFSSDGATLASCGSDSGLYLWRVV